jgi:hypothetical protein
MNEGGGNGLKNIAGEEASCFGGDYVEGLGFNIICHYFGAGHYTLCGDFTDKDGEAKSIFMERVTCKDCINVLKGNPDYDYPS